MHVFNHNRPRNQRRQSGFTLLEVILVLGLLVLVGALSWPMFQGTIAYARLRAGADQVRTAMAEARVRAMSTGLTFQLECQLESRTYKISPWENQGEGIEAADVSGEATATVESELPESVRFTKADSADTRASQMPSTDMFADFSKSTANKIFFYPDGSTSSAEVQVTNDQESSLVVSLRGITGVALVAEPSSQSPPTPGRL